MRMDQLTVWKVDSYLTSLPMFDLMEPYNAPLCRGWRPTFMG